MARIDKIEGIGPALREKFMKAGISTCEALLKKGGTKDGRKELEAATGIAEGQLLKFVNHADLMRIKGIGGEYSELLESAGVDTVPELAQRNASSLTAWIIQVNNEKKLVRATPSEKQVQDWITQAQALPRAIHH